MKFIFKFSHFKVFFLGATSLNSSLPHEPMLTHLLHGLITIISNDAAQYENNQHQDQQDDYHHHKEPLFQSFCEYHQHQHEDHHHVITISSQGTLFPFPMLLLS